MQTTIRKTTLHMKYLQILLLVVLVLQGSLIRAQQSQTVYLSGTDKDNTVDWQFRCSEGMNSGHWTTIPVPSCWEQQGFGAYNYGRDKQFHTEQGHYRHTFRADASWRDKRAMLCFEGVMTDATVLLNGDSIGGHKGAFYPFSFEVTDHLRLGQENTLEVIVDKHSSDASVNKAEREADYWIFGGIFRPVYLQLHPQDYIQRVAIDARHTGAYAVQVFLSQPVNPRLTVEMDIRTAEGKLLGRRITASGVGPDGAVTVAGRAENAVAWTAETPTLHEAVIRLKQGKRVVHEYRQKFGFRTIEFRQHDGFYVNDTKVRFKGVCRHTFWPESGRTSSPELACEDVRLIKQMNMNAVRMSHYPPDDFFLDACDSLGLYVLDELAGWQDKYSTDRAHQLIAEMVQRDVNHPSIVAWDNGNEGGFNFDVRRDYAIWDPQHRQVIEPWSRLDGLDTRHYPKYDYCVEAVTRGDMVFMPTESLHGLHDGGHGAGLDDYWELLRNSKLGAGQFLWVFADEGVVRRDIHDSIDVAGDLAPDGILGPHHEPEGSFYTIKQIWSPIQIAAPSFDGPFDGTLSVENRYDFINTSQCTFSYALQRYQQPLSLSGVEQQQGTIPSPSIAPQQQGSLHIPLPTDWQTYDVLSVTATDHKGKEIFTWRWNITPPRQMSQRILAQSESLQRKDADIKAWMQQLNPHIIGSPQPLDASVTWQSIGDSIVQVSYSYTLDGDYDYAGIALDISEAQTSGALMLANGPYRVWKNRLKGPTFGLYEKPYNNTITGQDYDYPEFKGYFSNLYAVQLHRTDGHDITIVVPDSGKYLQMYTPQRPRHMVRNADPVVPDADVSVLDVISAIGNKFSQPEQEGPQGSKAHFDSHTIRGTLYLYTKTQP